jgi:hypothetical protein
MLSALRRSPSILVRQVDHGDLQIDSDVEIMSSEHCACNRVNEPAAARRVQCMPTLNSPPVPKISSKVAPRRPKSTGTCHEKPAKIG